MAKTPVYHLDECQSCAHRHVCKHIDKIDKLLKNGTLPLDLQGASCNEYIPEDVIDEDWKDYADDYVYDGEDAHAYIAPPDENLPMTGLKRFIEQDDDEQPLPLEPQALAQGFNQCVAECLDAGLPIGKVFMNQETMSVLSSAFGLSGRNLHSVLLTTGQTLPLAIDNSIDSGYFVFEYEG